MKIYLILIFYRFIDLFFYFIFVYNLIVKIYLDYNNVWYKYINKHVYLLYK